MFKVEMGQLLPEDNLGMHGGGGKEPVERRGDSLFQAAYSAAKAIIRRHSHNVQQSLTLPLTKTQHTEGNAVYMARERESLNDNWTFLQITLMTQGTSGLEQDHKTLFLENDGNIKKKVVDEIAILTDSELLDEIREFNSRYEKPVFSEKDFHEPVGLFDPQTEQSQKLFRELFARTSGYETTSIREIIKDTVTYTVDITETHQGFTTIGLEITEPLDIQEGNSVETWRFYENSALNRYMLHDPREEAGSIPLNIDPEELFRVALMQRGVHIMRSLA